MPAPNTLQFNDLDATLKVLIVGSGSVGKSSLIRRLTRGEFNSTYKKTVGVDYAERTVTTSLGDVRLMVWDTAGQEEFDKLAQQYYNGAHAVAFTFSVTDRGSFDAVANWKRKVDSVLEQHQPNGSAKKAQLSATVLIMNKIDELLPGSLSMSSSTGATVSMPEAKALAQQLGLDLFPVSVKTGHGVDEVFTELAERHMKRLHEDAQVVSQTAPSVASRTSKPLAAGDATKSDSAVHSPSNTTQRTPASTLIPAAPRSGTASPVVPSPNASAPLVFTAAALEKEKKSRRPSSASPKPRSPGSAGAAGEKECLIM
ncbi:P-loop containing nucleoside triphosphate hydrolase protein [Catenaria anguillulae PL171]|uniref:p-loop containing nucleoside triphosphate hydrolase protein n=1 Tax=Catenaria anguillulae PL171 TaxID=765915 RepID=A0A1Y2HJ70_9FUNG|nr:P-loop containing nucleoside triphosphate hydrolase protein [Catenaria anguillulae PL171]